MLRASERAFLVVMGNLGTFLVVGEGKSKCYDLVFSCSAGFISELDRTSVTACFFCSVMLAGCRLGSTIVADLFSNVRLFRE